MLSAMEVVCGMRLHPLIFASAGGTPIVGISYDVKVDSFIRDIGSTACIPLKELTKEKLIHEIDLQAEQGFVQAPQAMARLREGERLNVGAARRLLEK